MKRLHTERLLLLNIIILLVALFIMSMQCTKLKENNEYLNKKLSNLEYSYDWVVMTSVQEEQKIEQLNTAYAALQEDCNIGSVDGGN